MGWILCGNPTAYGLERRCFYKGENKMGRPLNKKYFGNRNIGTNRPTDDGIGGEGVASVTLGGTNNSSGFSAGASQISFSAPQIANGTTTTGSLVIANGVIGSATTYTTLTGTSVTAAATYTAVVTKSTNGSGTGATFTVVKTGAGTTYSGATTITVVNGGSGYAVGNTITISGSVLGGADGTNDLTFTLATSVVNGRITSITVTNAGSGYTTAPTITLSTGTKGTLTTTAVLNVDSGNVGSSTNNENAILAWAYIGGSLVEVDIQKQISAKRYRVNATGDTGSYERVGTRIARINYTKVATGDQGYTAAEGIELNMVAVDSDGGTYLVRKLYNRTCTLNPIGINNATIGITNNTAGTQFASGKQVKWTFGSPTANSTVQILNA
jgi:hypothetical protein